MTDSTQSTDINQSTETICSLYINNAICYPGSIIKGLITLLPYNNQQQYILPHDILYSNNQYNLSSIKIQCIGKCIYDNNKINNNILQQQINNYINHINDINTIVKPTTIQTSNNNNDSNSSQFKIIDTKPINILLDNNNVIKFSILLPNNIPYSYNSKSFKYIYYIIIALYDIYNDKINEIKLPIKIINNKTIHNNNNSIDVPYNKLISLNYKLYKQLSDIKVDDNTDDLLDTNDSNTDINNSDTSYNQREHSRDNIDNTTQTITQSQLQLQSIDDNILHSNQPVLYNISQTLNDTTHINIMQLTLNKHIYSIGDTIYGHLNFRQSNIQCYRLVITLQSNEIIDNSISNNKHKKSNNNITTTILSSYHCYTRYIITNQFQFGICSDISSFTTQHIQYSYTLNFKFIIAKHDVTTEQLNNTTNNNDNVDVLLWSLPLTVLSNTLHIKQQSEIKSVVLNKYNDPVIT